MVSCPATSEHGSDALLHHIRGEILWKRAAPVLPRFSSNSALRQPIPRLHLYAAKLPQRLGPRLQAWRGGQAIACLKLDLPETAAAYDAVGGIVNPLNDELLVSLLEPAMDTRAIPADGRSR